MIIGDTQIRYCPKCGYREEPRALPFAATNNHNCPRGGYIKFVTYKAGIEDVEARAAVDEDIRCGASL
jgi:hypothetical protein